MENASRRDKQRNAAAELLSQRQHLEQNEKDLQAAEQRYQAIFDQTFQLVAVMNPSGRMEEANETLRRVCGLAAKDVKGAPIWDLPFEGGDDRARLRSGVAEAASGNFVRDEFTLRKASGDSAVVDLSIKPMRDRNGRVAQLVLEARDITDQRRDRQYFLHAQKMELLGQLASGIAHDFNNLLTIIGGNLELVGAKLKHEPALAERVDRAIDAVFRGRALTDQMLALARRQELATQDVDMQEFIAGVEDLLRHGLDERVSVDIDIADNVWRCLIDPAQLQMALLNLAVNSQDAMPNGGRVTVRARNLIVVEHRPDLPDVPLGDYVVLSVADEGNGITADIIDRVTEPLFTTKPAGSGTGLGLTMVYSFVRRSGGDLHIESTPGVGTEVSLYLPRAEESAPSPAPVKAPAGDASPRLRILVVEDNDEVRDIAVSMLSELGYRVEETADADAARVLLEAGKPIDLLLTDIQMPGTMDGEALAKFVRKRWPEVRILYSSGHARARSTIGGGADPGTGLVTKPYRRDDLARAVATLLAS